MRIEVEPQALIDAGKQVGSLGVQLGALSDAMGQVLASGIASGADPAGLNFGISYGRQADQFGQYLAQAANAFKNVGLMLEATGYNYQHADQASVAGGSGPSGSVSGEPAETTAADAPYGPNGSIVTPPTKYHLITPFIRLIPAFGMAAGVAMTWPSGNSGMMNVTAAQWRNIGQGLKVFESALSGAKAAVGAQDIPEGATITTALSDLGSGTTTLAGVADGLATSISDFATGVLETQDAIRDLLDRISLDGLWDTVTGFLSGDGDRVLREIADDVSTVLENFQNQVKGVLGLLEELATLLGEAADAFQKWIRPVLVETFGEGAGNALADGIKLFTDIQVGGATGLIALVSGTVALADPDTWKGIADTALMVAKDPSLIDDVLKQMGSEFIALDQWQGDNPGRGFGEAAVNVASLFVPGGAFAKGGAVAKGLAATRNLLQKGELGSLGRLPGLGGGRTPDAPELPDVPGVPHVPEFTPPPGIPGSVLGPGGPSSPTPSAPTSPGSGSGGGSGPTGPSPNGSGPSQSGGGAGPGSSSSNGPAPTGGSPSPGGDSGSSSNGPVPTGGSPSSDGGDGPSKPSSGAPVSPPMSPPGDSPGSSGPSPAGGGDGPGSGSSDGGGSRFDNGSSNGSPSEQGSNPSGGAAGHDGPSRTPHSDGADPEYRSPGTDPAPSKTDGDQTGTDLESDSSPNGTYERQDPVHSNDTEGPGWERLPDNFRDPEPSEPWDFPDDPADAERITPDVADLMQDPSAPLGRDSDGNPYTSERYAEEFNNLGPKGQHWVNFPDNDGAVPGTRVAYSDFDQFTRDYGNQFDRIGDDKGKYFGVIEDGRPASWEERAMHVSSLRDPYSTFTVDHLPEGWKIEVSEIASGLGQPGGGLQARIMDETGKFWPVEELLTIDDGVIRR